MLSLAFIRANADVVRRAAELKGETAPVDEVLRLDQEWRGHQFKAESIKAEQNELSKQFAKTRDDSLKEKLREMADTAKGELAPADTVKRALDDLPLRLPNIFDESGPIGETEAEVPVTNFHRDEILEPDRLPLKYVAYAPSWRTEAGAAGKDTRGFIRLHQFSKVELVKVTSAETSLEEFEQLTRDAEDILQRLGLHYQVMAMCTGDMGFAQYKKYDLNAWAPGLDRYLEVSSCSTFNDFQAMRANIRYRPGRGASPKFAHTINGSGLALPRTVDAIIETYQRSDGMIAVPDVLKPYLGGVELIGAR